MKPEDTSKLKAIISKDRRFGQLP